MTIIHLVLPLQTTSSDLPCGGTEAFPFLKRHDLVLLRMGFIVPFLLPAKR